MIDTGVAWIPLAGKKAASLIAVLALLVATPACTRNDGIAPEPAPTVVAAEAEAPEHVRQLVADALGTGIATQDFHIVLEIARIDENGNDISLYDAVIAQAAIGAGEAIEVEGGLLAWRPTNSLQGRIVDAEETQVPGAEIGFGLLGLTEAGRVHVLQEWSSDGGGGLTEEDLDDQMLVVYSTTNLAKTAAHIAPGDQFLVDMTFVDGLAAGDTVRQSVVFGQALEMPEEASTDWSSAETFARRFTSGSIGILADSETRTEGSFLVATSERVAIQGSVLTRKQIKVLKFAPVALGMSGMTVFTCAKSLKNPYAGGLKCIHTFNNMLDKSKEAGRKTNERNRNQPPCRGRQCGRAGGDVHLRTFDQRHYDLQSVGEFVAARSDAGHELQLRMSPWSSSRHVSVNTGIAARIEGAAVSIELRDGELEIFIDGTSATLERGSFRMVGDGGVLISTGNTFIGRWRDGTQLNVDVNRVGNKRGSVVLAPADASGTIWQGLFGSPDGDPANDLAMPDGTVLAEPTTAELHGGFADAWRVSAETSLFHYRPGEDTETFTDRTFPDAYTTLADLDPEARARAEAMCRDYGITDQAALDDCILDVALTGDPSFIVDAGMLQDDTASAAISFLADGTPEASLQAPASVETGALLEVAWTGPAYHRDYLSLATPDQHAGQYRRYRYVDPESGTVTLQVPGEPGRYELRYVLGSDNRIIVTRPLEVTDATATVNAPERVEAGATVEVTWTGPANERDYLSLATPDQHAGQYRRYRYVDPESGTVTMSVPDEPGTYEVRYVLASDSTVIARKMIEVVR